MTVRRRARNCPRDGSRPRTDRFGAMRRGAAAGPHQGADRAGADNCGRPMPEPQPALLAFRGPERGSLLCHNQAPPVRSWQSS